MASTVPRVDPRLGLAVASARCVSGLSRALRLGGGTAAPGRVASRVDPRALEKLSRRLGQGVIVVAGTNGKTTTARIMAEILAADGRRVVHNRAGANMVGGIVSSLAATAAPGGQRGRATAVLETDEAALPEMIRRAAPSVVVLTNLFRDQLDRYAEMDQVLDRWRAALMTLSAATTVVVNADDPALVALTDDLVAPRLCFGIAETLYELTDVPHAAESTRCPRCDARLAYRSIFVGHLGDWFCPGCDHSRPALDVSGSAIELWSYDFQSLEVSGAGEATRFEVGLPGLYNTYNVLAALAGASALHVDSLVAQQAVARYRGAFGRAERVTHRGRSLMIMLVKNPVGCNEVLRTIAGVDRALDSPVLLCLNDAASDGRDVSWIWDVDFERLATSSAPVFCAGSRWADLANRLHYAGVASERIFGLGADVAAALEDFTDSLDLGASGFILPTYSAMLEVRQALARHQRLPVFWDE